MRTIDIIKIYKYGMITQVVSFWGRYKITFTEEAKELLKVTDMDNNPPYFFWTLTKAIQFYNNVTKNLK